LEKFTIVHPGKIFPTPVLVPDKRWRSNCLPSRKAAL